MANVEARNHKRTAAACALLIALAATQSVAHADVGGEQFSPGNCPYPAVGAFGLDGVVEHYVCDYPTEINGSRHHCVYGGTATTAAAQASMLIFSATVATSLGVLEGVCYWACPDGSVAAEPNPVMTWQGSSTATRPVTHSRCIAIAPNPVSPGDDNP